MRTQTERKLVMLCDATPILMLDKYHLMFEYMASFSLCVAEPLLARLTRLVFCMRETCRTCAAYMAVSVDLNHFNWCHTDHSAAAA